MMNLRDSLHKYYYDTIVCDLQQLNHTGNGELSYNSIMYLDVISYQQNEGNCTVSSLAKTLRISNSAVTLKVNELVKLGLVEKTRSQEDRRVVYLTITDLVANSLKNYDSPFERAVQAVEKNFSPTEIHTFCQIIETFLHHYQQEFIENETKSNI